MAIFWLFLTLTILNSSVKGFEAKKKKKKEEKELSYI